MLSKKQTKAAIETMGELFPEAECELIHRNSFELLIAVVLSAQCTDVLVNKVTASLFETYRTPEDFISVSLEQVQSDIRSIGLYRNKAKNIQGLSHELIEKYDSQVPHDRQALEALPGVGRKTANVVLSVAFNEPAIAVDTHVERVSKRLGICRWKDSVRQVEETLMDKLDEDMWSDAHHRMIFFGRYHCKSRQPNCPNCPLLPSCREGKKRLKEAAS
ncbi:endonuclease III [Aureibacillus halotolerans]|uniref:Endonuclease III n=1 Tax=Aureibacillus halotolerans TaxID=1508390 RepID=A0A4R6U9Y0_9BACI|nr:endonuclease III [Aureibacillus halotolerans]TDQ41495.1 DNA-(apurinic or apyrimidinic site) lyase /endonuclease III [Aureibacillus halotolerans]